MARDSLLTGPPEVLASRGVVFTAHRHPALDDPRDVCAVLGVALEKTVKTLAFVTPEDRLVLAAFPGHARLKYGALARAAGVRRADLRPAPAERLAAAGMEPGGVCPVSADPEALVVFDEAVADLERVHCGSGRRDSSLELRAADLMAAVPSACHAPIASAG
jgi:Cys-tRNA(Pro)/Cys-tRNA(Cys) deacylase